MYRRPAVAGEDMSEERFERIEGQLDQLTQEVREFKADVNRQFAEVKEDVKQVKEDLSHQMRVLHEDLVDRIKAIPGHTGPARVEFDEHKETTDRRLSPLELAVRQHSADIKMLKSSHG
jgi:small-conductance mechanosensitive channel